VDVFTHGLASLAVARGFFPRAGKAVMASTVLAGILADLDRLSVYFGPLAFLHWHWTYAHSFIFALLVSAVLGLLVFVGLARKQKKVNTTSAETALSGKNAVMLVAVFLAPLCAALLHIAMDACQSNGVMLLWPFSARRFAADWLPGLDPWILTILIACIAIPELLRLVSSEIGAKEKKPRGQTGAILGLALILVYGGVRATLHSNVLAALQARTFHGEAARRASAFPESLSLITWHGIVETESALDAIDINAAATSKFDPDSSLRLFKPQDSPALDAARVTSAANRFLAVARIPKASVEKNETGYVVVLRDLRYTAAGETQNEIAALIELDLNNKVLSQDIVWARDLPR
jgi:membrane-bound metal-dependent hydrolase YbcI (DUF457 family)